MTTNAASPDQPSQIHVAVLCGSDSVRSVSWDRNQPTPATGNNDMWRLIHEAGFGWERFHIAPNYFRQARRWNFEDYDLLCNTITDADQNPDTLAVAERIAAACGKPVINRPSAIRATQRETVAKRLQGVPGMIVPKVLRLKNPVLKRVMMQVETEGFRFPAILRSTGTHSGRIINIVQRPEDLESIFGDRENEFFLTEYVDFASPDNLYRKMRLFFFGREVMIRHMITAPSWNVHARERRGLMAEREDLRNEERATIERGIQNFSADVRAGLSQLRTRLDLDYFGLDCALAKDGQLIVFEANATMNFYPFSDNPTYAYMRACIAPAVHAMKRLILSRVSRKQAAFEPAPIQTAS